MLTVDHLDGRYGLRLPVCPLPRQQEFRDAIFAIRDLNEIGWGDTLPQPLIVAFQNVDNDSCRQPTGLAKILNSPDFLFASVRLDQG